MKKNRLLALLRNLDAREFKRLEEMVYSPFFNKDRKVTLLFELLKPFAPAFDSPQLTKQWLFEQLFDGRKKITSSLSIKMSKLQTLVKEYLTLNRLEERPYYKRHLLLDALLEKEQFDFFQSQYREDYKSSGKTA